MTILGNTQLPAVLLWELPWLLVFAWVARRLLDAGRLSVWVTLLSGALGYVAGIALAWVVVGGPGEAGFILSATVFAVASIMLAIVVLELVAKPHTGARLPHAPSVPRPVRALRLRYQTCCRLIQVSHIVMRHTLGSRARHSAAAERGPAQRARLILEDAGGMFIKLGQLLSTRVDLLPGSAAEFAKLQENAPPCEGGAIKHAVEAEFGRPVEEVFADFEWEPLAAASLGQVHRARLHTGERVAVKVRRPGVEDVVQRDLTIVRWMARIIEARTEWGRAYGVIALAKDFSDRLAEELDYRNEATNVAEVAAALDGMPDIHVHKVWEDLSTTRLLVMEFLDGVSVGQLVGHQGATATERKRLADPLMRAELESMLSGRWFHADPHPGNVFLMPDGRLGLLDFGAAGRLDSFERESVIAILRAVRDADPAQLREAVVDVAEIPVDADLHALDRALARFLARHVGGRAVPNAAMLNELLGIFGTHRIALPPTTSTMFRALVVLEGTLNALVSGFPVVAEAEKLSRRLAVSQLTAESVLATGRDALLDHASVMQRMPRHIDRIATLAERGELHTRVSLLSDRHDERVVTRLVDRCVLALIGSALGVFSAILLSASDGSLGAGSLTVLDVLGYLGLSVGAVLLLRVVLAVLRDDHHG